MLTPELEEIADRLLGMDLTTTKLRLMPYLHHLVLNFDGIDDRKINDEERHILSDWIAMGYIEVSLKRIKFSRAFWDAVNEILWISYANA